MRLGNCGYAPGDRRWLVSGGKIGHVERHRVGSSGKRRLAVRLAPSREVIPIGTVGPNGVLRLRLLDKLGSPICDFGQRSELGVRGTVGKDEVGRHQEKTADPRYSSIIRG